MNRQFNDFHLIRLNIKLQKLHGISRERQNKELLSKKLRMRFKQSEQRDAKQKLANNRNRARVQKRHPSYAMGGRTSFKPMTIVGPTMLQKKFKARKNPITFRANITDDNLIQYLMKSRSKCQTNREKILPRKAINMYRVTLLKLQPFALFANH